MKLIYKFFASSFVIFTMCMFTAPKNIYAATSPSLGQAASFAILAGTAITNIPTSVITGDVGLSPDSGSNYSGLSTSEVSGTIYAPDSSGPAGAAGNNPSLLTNAKTDLVTAYNGLASGANADANCDPSYQFGSGNKDLSGANLVAGVYCADTFTLTGTLTLSGSGVWVFRSASTLITSGTANIIGGNACNIWWQVPSSATLGTTTSLKGNILALTSITMNTGATLVGRALARNAAVTTQSNTINQSCSSSIATSVPVALTVAGSSLASCPALDSNIVDPIIIQSKRIDADSINISWGPYSGTNLFNVQYGLENGAWIYNTDVTGFSTTINSLPSNTPIWVRVAARNSCAIGEYGSSRLVGGPGLPNAGNGPIGVNKIVYILGSVLVALPYLIIFLRRKYYFEK